MLNFIYFREMPSIHHTWTKREVMPPTGDIKENTESSVMEATRAPPPALQEVPPESPSTEMSGISTSTSEPGGEHLRKHIFGNKTYHPSHGRTTPFPEPGIS